MKLSLVTCSIGLFPATSTRDKIAFHLLNKATGHRLKQQYIDAETGELVPREQRTKGYEVTKDEYVVVSDEELASVEIPSNHILDIERFVERLEVDSIYFDQSYYIVPEDKVGQEAFAVIREAMSERKVAGRAADPS